MTALQDSSVLGRVAFGYSPMIDRQRAVVATRLTVFPDRPDAVLDAPALLRLLDEVWPPPGAEDSGENGAAPGTLKLTLRPLDPKAVQARPAGGQAPVTLNITSEALLHAVMAAAPGPHLMIEVPAFMVADPSSHGPLQALHAAGTPLLIKGRPSSPLPALLLPCFSHSIVDAGDERRTSVEAPPGVRRITTVQSGARTAAELEAAFKRGAVAVLGWQFDDEPPRRTGRTTVPPDFKVVLELIQGVDREEPVGRLEAILKRDPTLAFRLMRYLNSPAFGLSAEITSFGHAIMLLGYQRLKRWLALLLASSSKDPAARPTMFAAVRRGLLMEELVRSNNDAEMRGEMFICGVFSLLDRLLQQPFDELLGSMPVPERVQQALRGTGGPYQPYLQLVQAIEQESLLDIRDCSERLMLAPAEVNRALLAALRGARQID